jgi:phosphopantothenoylcysteine synthetase/decarboxylase
MGPRFLVTAGSTRERIDAVRDWGNIFTGETGFAIARALAARGKVDLLTSNRQHLGEIAQDPELRRSVHGAVFGTHAELKAALAERMGGEEFQAVFMTAAVSDYRPSGAFELVSREAGEGPGEERWVVRDAQAGKVAGSYERVAFLGERTEKLVDLFRGEWGYRGLLVKFKLEVGVDRARLLEIGRRSRVTSGADYLVANTLDMVPGRESQGNAAEAGAYLIGPEGEAFVPRAELAERLAALVRT